MNRDHRSSLILPLQRLFWRRVDGPSRGMLDLSTLSPLLQCLPPAPPPPGLLAQIEARIGLKQRPRSGRLTGPRVAGAWLVGAAAGAAAILAWGPQQIVRTSDAIVHLSVVDGTDRVAILGARTLAGGQYLRIDHFGLHTAADRALELWLLSDGNGRPASLGRLAAREGVTILPLAQPIAEGDFLAVSEEPPGGAPGPGPSGPVVLTARVGIEF